MRSGFSVMSEKRLMSRSSENLNPSLLSFVAFILIEFKGFMIIAPSYKQMIVASRNFGKILPELARVEIFSK